MNRIRAIVFLVACITAVILVFYPVYYLVIKSGNNILLRLPLREGDVIHYRFLHSVAKSYYDEFWSLGRDGKLYLIKVIFRDEGAGLPISTFRKEKFVFLGNRFGLNHMKRRLPNPLYIMVSGSNQETLFINGRSFRIYRRGERVYTLRIERMLWFSSLFCRKGRYR